MTIKKNPDYTASAVNLTNSPDVEYLLERYYYWQSQVRIVDKDIEEHMAKTAQHLVDARKHSQETLGTVRADLEDAIKEYGSYQDVENGHYALLQARKAKEWHAEAFLSPIKATPAMKKAADMVIVQSVNAMAVEGLIKGRLLTEEELIDSGALTFKELTPALVIK